MKTMKTLTKTLIAACLLATLCATSTAFAISWPSDPQPVKGVEGPDVPRG